MKRTRSFKPKQHHKGDFLIEALIGALLIGIVGAGIATTATQVAKTQNLSQRQAIAISNLEGAASGGDLTKICADNGVPNLGGDVQYTGTSVCNSDGTMPTFDLSLNLVNSTEPARTVITAQPLVMEATLKRDAQDSGVTIRVGQISQ